MTNFFLDIWSDLREKRLWPVAVALLVGVLAVPVLLSKPAEDVAPAAAPNPAAPTGGTAAAGQVVPADLEAAKPLLQTSTLNEFDSKDPFKPLKALESVEQAAGVQPSAPDSLAAGETGGAGAGGGTGGGDTGGGTGGGETPSVQEEEKTVFTYQAVVELTTASGVKKRVVNRLGILPKDTNPLLVFLGVSADNNDEAVFLVDSTLTQAGEGRCRPSAATCSFLYLTTNKENDEHIFTTDDGKEYGIKLLKVRRVEVSKSSAPQPGANAGSARAKFTAVDDEDPFAGFGFPLFADEEE